MSVEIDPFRNRHKFQDDVWRQIKLNDLERDVIDTPEFQRLFRTSQLGFVDLAYQTANHTRGAHSIGACHIANLLVDRLCENTAERYDMDDSARELYANFTISSAERILIRLGALLHDISHVPLSHDVERKTHRIFYDRAGKEREALKVRSWYGHYDKHDDYERNPLLYILTFDLGSSVLARVLQRYSDPFYDELVKSASDSGHEHLREFVELVKSHKQDDLWSARKQLLPELLFHLLTYEKAEEAKTTVRQILTSFDTQQLKPWHLGPKSLSPADKDRWHHLWYQPFRHDIIGNTLSADLIDYLTRDPQRLATKRHIDLHLLNYYVLVHFQGDDISAQPRRFRCAIDLYDYKRGTTRTFLLNDVFRLLDLRQEIHEKAVMHRVVQSANAMLSRALLLLNRGGKRPLQRDLAAFGARHHALQSEDLFLYDLLRRCEDRGGQNDRAGLHLDSARRILEKIIERRVYRPLMVIPGDRAVLRLHLPSGDSEDGNEFPLRTFAAIIDSAYYSRFLLFACWCVEKYLEGVFDSAIDLISYAGQHISSDRAPAENARKTFELVPSRVLIWTSPYKQLYKDPAVVVSLDGCVGQVDQIYKDPLGPGVLERSTQERIRNAISDADTKYATLWRLYVFISDGLFYSGILNKLLDKIEAPNRDAPLVRLENAQALLTVAFEAICNDWTTLSSDLPDAKQVEDRLQRQMDVEALKPLIGKWLADYRNETSRGVNRAKGLSTVRVSNYSHGYTIGNRVNHPDSARCRDTRYKFDVSAVEMWNVAAADPLSDGYSLIEFLGKCGIEEPELLSQREFEELVELYREEAVSEACRARLSEASVSGALKELWMFDFPRKVVPQPQIYPRSEPDIRQWLSRHGEKLSGKRISYRAWSRTTERIAAFVMNRDRKIWPQIFDDLELRISNEAELFWNNTKGKQILTLLKSKWPLELPG